MSFNWRQCLVCCLFLEEKKSEWKRAGPRLCVGVYSSPRPPAHLPAVSREKKGSSSRFAAAALCQRNSPESPAKSAIFMPGVRLRLSESLTSKTACQGSPHTHHVLHSLLLHWFNGCSGIREEIPLDWKETWSKTKGSCQATTVFTRCSVWRRRRWTLEGWWKGRMKNGGGGRGAKKCAGVFTSERKFRDNLKKFRVQNKIRRKS